MQIYAYQLLLIRISRHPHCSQLSRDEMNTAQSQAAYSFLFEFFAILYFHNLAIASSLGLHLELKPLH